MHRRGLIAPATVGDVIHHLRWWRKSVPNAPLRSSGVAGTKTPQLVIPRFPLFSGPGLHLEYGNLEQSLGAGGKTEEDRGELCLTLTHWSGEEYFQG